MMGAARHDAADRLVTNITIHLRAEKLRDRDFVGRSDSFAILYIDSRVPTISSASAQSLMASPAPPPEAPGGPRDRRWDRIGLTETLADNCSPRWATSFQVPYFFERAQRIAVDVYGRGSDYDEPLAGHNFLGTADCSVPTLVRARGQRLELTLRDAGNPGQSCGTVTLIAEEEVSFKQLVELAVEVHDLRQSMFTRTDPTLTISRPSVGSRAEAARSPVSYGPSSPSSSVSVPPPPATDWIVVHGPVPSRRTSSSTFVFDMFAVNHQLLCFGDDTLTMQFDVIGSKGVPFASASASLAEWRANPNLALHAPKETSSTGPRRLLKRPVFSTAPRSRELGQLALRSSSQHMQHTFLDYVGAGHEISLVIAVDYTASNGDPNQPGSLHFLDQYNQNEYEVAIQSVGEILAQYDSDQMFPAYGFGAKLPPLFRTPSHCFSLTGGDDASCVEIGGVLDAYRQTLYNVRFSGPTEFAEIIQAAIRHVELDMAQGAQTYTIMLIVTDGVINDMQQTVDEIVRASSMPLSIVIIGVGASDFSDMDQLDGDGVLLKSASGHLAERDIVQFVPFRKYRGAPEVLAAKVLEEIPGQFMQYMTEHKIFPPEYADDAGGGAAGV
jgi:copine 5/8/9